MAKAGGEISIDVRGLDEVKAEIQALQDHVDLMVDEFERVASLVRCQQRALSPALVNEIVGLCERAITNAKQRVPVIEQRDAAIAKLDRVKRWAYDTLDLIK